MEEFPCPNCDLVFVDLFSLYEHAYNKHRRRERMKSLTKEDFVQIDSAWICPVGGAQLILAPNANGDFKLQIIWTVEPIPPATQYPTEPEWDVALVVANKFKDFQGTAVRRQI